VGGGGKDKTLRFTISERKNWIEQHRIETPSSGRKMETKRGMRLSSQKIELTPYESCRSQWNWREKKPSLQSGYSGRRGRGGGKLENAHLTSMRTTRRSDTGFKKKLPRATAKTERREPMRREKQHWGDKIRHRHQREGGNRRLIESRESISFRVGCGGNEKAENEFNTGGSWRLGRHFCLIQ